MNINILKVFLHKLGVTFPSAGGGGEDSGPALMAQLSTLASARLAGATVMTESAVPSVFQIPFDTVDENAGGHFSVGTGLYTAPATGKYLVTASARCYGAQTSALEVRVGGVVKRSVQDNGVANNITAVVSANEGDLIGAAISAGSIDAGSSIGDDIFGLGNTSITIVQLVDGGSGGGEEGGGGAVPYILRKTITVSAPGDIEVLRVPMPVGTSWQIAMNGGEAILAGIAMSCGAEPIFASNESGTVFIRPANPRAFYPIDDSVTPLPLGMEESLITVVQDGGDLVVMWHTEQAIVGQATFLFFGVRSDGVGFTSTDTPAGGPVAPTEVTESRALTAGDHGLMLVCKGATPITLMVPAGLPAGFQVKIVQGGAGGVVVATDGGGVEMLGFENGITCEDLGSLAQIENFDTDRYIVSATIGFQPAPPPQP
ncbi:hypothetical protein D3C71_77980 [compost metagenome]